jgi:gentisate 1,2-dioxygenase
MGSIVIVYQEPGKRPLSVVSVENRELLEQAAHLALQVAERRVSMAENPVIARLEAAEAQRLRTALNILVPGMTAEARSSSN